MKDLLLKLRKTVWFIRSKFYKPSEIEKRIKEIMGDDFFSIEDSIKYLGAKPTLAELYLLREKELKKYSEEQLIECKGNCVLSTIFTISDMEIIERIDSKLFDEQRWYKNDGFARSRGIVCCKLLKKQVQVDSREQVQVGAREQASWNKSEKRLTAQQMIYVMIGYYLKTGKRLFENTYVATWDIDLETRRVLAGCFNSRFQISHGC